MNNILTVDLEAYFNLCGIERLYPRSSWGERDSRMRESLDLLLKLLQEYRAKATFFTLGYWAQQQPELVTQLLAAGHDLGAHSYWHTQLYRMDGDEFARDLERTLAVLTALSRKPVRSFRAPEWSIRPGLTWFYPCLAQQGITYSSSLMPVPGLGDPRAPSMPHWVTTPSGPVYEIPPLTLPGPGFNLPLGGGLPLRVLPYPVVAARIRALNAKGCPALIYVHPWELDLKQPKVLRYSLRGWAHYSALAQARPRLERLLADFTWESLEQACLDSRPEA